MKNELIGCVGLFLVCCSPALLRAEPPTVDLPERENFHLFLLAGQSNMAGRGAVEDVDRKAHPRVLALSKEGQWVPAVDPIHYDKRVAGVGLAKSFAIALAEADPSVAIGLIPAACGGSPIESWTPGGYHDQTKSHPYDDAIERTRRATRDGVLKGILWHQGESDSSDERAGLYEARLRELVARFRRDLNAPDLPFVIGQLGQFPTRPWTDGRREVDRAQRAVAEADARVGFVPSEGLSCKSDNTHFDTPSLREFGRRYAEVYRAIAE